MNVVIYVIDTSYLLEIYECPGFCNPKAAQKIHELFAEAIKARARFFVP